MNDFEGDLPESEPEPKKTKGGLSLDQRCGGCNKPFAWKTVKTRTAFSEEECVLHFCQECENAHVEKYRKARFRGYRWGRDPETRTIMPRAEIFYPMTKTPPAERPHSPNSPSSLLYKSKCSGFKNDNTGDKTAANLGELGHLAFERESTDCIPPGDEYDRLREAAQMCIDVKRSVKSRFRKPTTLEEDRVDITDEDFGYIDAFVYEGDKGVLLDPKFSWSVGAYTANSPQFKAYAVGLFKMFPAVNEIEVMVLLPYLGEVDCESFSRGHLDVLTAETVAVIEGAKRADPATFRTGEFCQWCGRKSLCPKLHDMALVLSRNYHPEEIELPSEYDPRNITDPEIMSRALIVAPLFEKFASHAKARAMEMRLNEGLEIPGFELKERATAFVITDAALAWDVVKEKLTPEQFASAAKVQIGALEKAWKENAPRGEKAKAVEELRDKLVDADAAKSEGTVHYFKRVKEAKAELEG